MNLDTNLAARYGFKCFFSYCSPGRAEDDKWENGGRARNAQLSSLSVVLWARAARYQSRHLPSADRVPGSGVSALLASPHVTFLTAL